ncbi:DUF5719 family protein [Paramicrobacterium sp. CJ85]|uniref:DUF5719 family protein n=1 Tax=Paramicrobacterium sp. CJ85 TaxID=3445355 RepID=UPI003F5E7BA7
MTKLNTLWGVGVRTAVGATTVVVLGLCGTAAFFVDAPSYRAEAVPEKVTPVPSDQLRVCAGSLLDVGRDADAATAVTRLGDPTLASHATDDAELVTDSIAAPDVTSDADGPATVSLSADAIADGALSAAALSQNVTTETTAGFAASECRETANELWLSAGSTDVGRTSLVVLNNPTDVEASVDLEVSGENGPIESPNSKGLLIAPRSQKVVSLAGIAPNTVMPVVHVTSTGTDIQAWLQQSSIRGLVPAGIEMAGAGAAPSESVWIPAVTIYGGQPKVSTGSYDDRTPSLRLYATEDKPTHVAATVTDEDGDTVETFDVDIKAQTVTEFPLTSLDSGRYSIELDASSPIVASARTTTEDDKQGDFTWFSSADPLNSAFEVPAAPGPEPTLVVTNPGDESVDVAIGDRSETIEPGGMVTAEASDPLTVDPSAPVMAAVTYGKGTEVSSFTITPPKPASEPVDVYVR